MKINNIRLHIYKKDIKMHYVFRFCSNFLLKIESVTIWKVKTCLMERLCFARRTTQSHRELTCTIPRQSIDVNVKRRQMSLLRNRHMTGNSNSTVGYYNVVIKRNVMSWKFNSATYIKTWSRICKDVGLKQYKSSNDNSWIVSCAETRK